MRIQGNTTLRAVAFAVCTALDRIGVRAVLTGGSAATIWAPEAVQSLDCDFIVTFTTPGSRPEPVMHNLGYTERGGTYYHAQNPISVEFPQGPLSVGEDLIKRWVTLTEGKELLHVLSPTDSCRDRLAAFYHWHDYSSLDQALAVARSQTINLRKIGQWSRREGAEKAYHEFLRRRRALPAGA